MDILAVGDIIVQMSGAGAGLVFQPAAGVSVMITSCTLNGNTATPSYLSGGNLSALNRNANLSLTEVGTKYFIDNTVHWNNPALGGAIRTAFSGIQVQ